MILFIAAYVLIGLVTAVVLTRRFQSARYTTCRQRYQGEDAAEALLVATVWPVALVALVAYGLVMSFARLATWGMR